MNLTWLDCFFGLHKWIASKNVDLKSGTQDIHCLFCKKKMEIPISIVRPDFRDGRCHHVHLMTSDIVEKTVLGNITHYDRTTMECWDCSELLKPYHDRVKP